MSAKKYKVKGNIREWSDGAIVTEADLAKYPELGGVARLRDALGVLEDHFDLPPGEPAPATQTVTQTVTRAEGAGPNVPTPGRRSGKS